MRQFLRAMLSGRDYLRARRLSLKSGQKYLHNTEFIYILLQEEESLSFLLSLVYEEYKKVPRWIWSPSTRHIYQVFSCGLHISCIERNWLPFSKCCITFDKSYDNF